MRSSLALAAALSAALAACSFAPTYRTPMSPATPPSYQESKDWKLAQPQDESSKGAWWMAYHDPDLDALQAEMADANQDLKAAVARLAQARAVTRIARSSLLPTVNASASAARARNSVDSAKYVPGSEPTGNSFDLEADLSYEIDIWGRVRNNVAAAKAEQQASAADLAALTLALRAELTMQYFTLRADDSQQLLLDQTVADYVKALQLTENLFRGGAAAAADVAQAQAQLENARTQAADIRLQRAQVEHALAVLLGKNPSAYQLAARPLAKVEPPTLNPGLPSALLERRPDVAASERRVAAANAQIGVARAAYFPVFSLSAALGLDSARSSNWISASSRMWSAGPQALLTVFDAGRHRAQTAQARAAFDEQVADYRGTVLVAYQEVEDNVAALRQLEQESGSEAAAVDATGRALQQAQYRYKAGLVTYLEVATTENIALQAQLLNVSIQLRLLNASVLLVKALGGGWTPLDATL